MADTLTTIPNVGPKVAARLRQVGIEEPADLRGRDPDELFERMCVREGRALDPCCSTRSWRRSRTPTVSPPGRGGSSRASGSRGAAESESPTTFKELTGRDPQTLRAVLQGTV